MLKLVQTCGACPEQYDVYLEGNIVGYMRLRHGHFRAECYSEVVYSADTEGDGLFADHERDIHLNAACRCIEIALNKQKEEFYKIVESTEEPT